MSAKPDLFKELPSQVHVESHAEYVDGTAALTGYTLTEMPAELRKINSINPDQQEGAYAELAAKHTEVLERSAAAILSNNNRDVAEVAQLDLLFMLGSYLPGGDTADHQVPPQLRALLTYNTARFGLPDHMDYDMIIDVNTREYQKTGSIRVYSDGLEAASERDFYIGHYYAEPYVKMAAWSVKAMLDQSSTPNKAALFTTAAENLGQCRAIIGQYARMSTEHFDYFRQFLMPYADGTRNASGTFLPSVQFLEILLRPPTLKQQEFLQSATAYFPGWSRELISDQVSASVQGHNVVSLLRSGKLQMSLGELEALRVLAVEFRTTKITHAAAAHKHIPGAFENSKRLKLEDMIGAEQGIFEITSVGGTGGYDVTNLLSNGLKRLNEFVREVDDLITLKRA